RHEKNWMPQIKCSASMAEDDTLQFIYSCDPTRVVDEQAKTVSETTSVITAEHFRGGSQLIPFDSGWLTLIHEVLWVPSVTRREYQHRFVWFDAENVLRRVSRPFYFCRKGIEFAAGVTWHPDGKRLLVSYGVGDGESWLATVNPDDVQRILDDAER